MLAVGNSVWLHGKEPCLYMVLQLGDDLSRDIHLAPYIIIIKMYSIYIPPFILPQ